MAVVGRQSIPRHFCLALRMHFFPSGFQQHLSHWSFSQTSGNTALYISAATHHSIWGTRVKREWKVERGQQRCGASMFWA